MGVGANDVSVKSHQKFNMKPLQSLFSLFADRGFAALSSRLCRLPFVDFSAKERESSQSNPILSHSFHFTFINFVLERNSGYILDSKDVSCHFSLKFSIFKFQFSFISSATQTLLHLIAAERYSIALYAEISDIKTTYYT